MRAAALALRDLLNELGLKCWVKTSGSKGFHIVVPLDGEDGFGDVSRFAHVAGTLLVKRDPEHLTQEFSKADRGGRILVDTGRNALQRDVRGGLCGAREARCARVRAVHLGRTRTRRGRAANVDTAEDGRPHCGSRRPVVGHAELPAVPASSNREIAPHVGQNGKHK